ncbi:hypothetical protein [Flavobacterium sp. 83]|uniref:hypothetical protein n=1 Tax=Flavobacterium sp. 83 TaxID=1131812 RepID=UPI000556B340|nr:hypothetical protein [Flavobacterium sp. 83]
MSRNNQMPLGCYLIIIVIAIPFFIVNTCNDKIRDNEKQKEYDELSEQRKTYLKQFDFNFEEIVKDIENVNLQNIQKSIPRKPILIFQKRVYDTKKEIFFNYQLNTKLKNKYMSFKNSEINTIVLISDTLINIGHYSRTNKVGFKNNIIITYIDKKTNEVIYKKTIEGEKPPDEIRYYENDDSNEVYGTRPSDLEIYENILNNIK